MNPQYYPQSPNYPMDMSTRFAGPPPQVGPQGAHGLQPAQMQRPRSGGPDQGNYNPNYPPVNENGLSPTPTYAAHPKAPVQMQPMPRAPQPVAQYENGYQYQMSGQSPYAPGPQAFQGTGPPPPPSSAQHRPLSGGPGPLADQMGGLNLGPRDPYNQPPTMPPRAAYEANVPQPSRPQIPASGPGPQPLPQNYGDPAFQQPNFPPQEAAQYGGRQYIEPNSPNVLQHQQQHQQQHPGAPMQARYPPAPMSGGMPPNANMGGGYHQPPPGPGHHGPSHHGPGPVGQPQPQQPRKLDPEMMPSPVQVIEDDRKNRRGEFQTHLRGQVPPLVTTDFVTLDQGNCNPRFIRSTMYSVPTNSDMLKQTSIPFAITISPFADLQPKEHPPPVVGLGEIGPVRCIRCKAYMCSFMQFIDGGRRFACSFCRATTEVPPEYFAHLDHTGQRVDKYERPELCLGSYEYVTTKEYCKNNEFPNPPAFVFVIDVSYNNIKSGMVQLLCEEMINILRLLPAESRNEKSKIKVGFITYSNVVHFYNLKSCLAQPQMMVVPDVSDMFVPLLDGFLVDVQESEGLIMSLMEQIPQMFGDTRETETILAPAIKAGLEALMAANCTGKIFVFHSSLPIAEAPGKLRNRDDRKLLGTDKEKTVLAPQTNFYNQLGQDCVSAGTSVDIFAFPNAYIDVATIGQLCRLTGGQFYKYTYFQADLDGVRFLEDLKRNIQRQTAFDAIMRIRTSTGVRPVEFFGNYYMSNTTDVELASVDADKALSVEIRHDDKLTDEDAVYIQAAILYTSIGGQRRLRVHNLALNTCNQMADLFRNCELDTIINYFSKYCLRQLCEQIPKALKEAVVSRCAQTLASYRKNCASPSSVGQLILPECMKLLPLYINCLLKCDAISGAEISTDDRSYIMHSLNSMDVASSLGYIYPRLLQLHTLDFSASEDVLPVATRSSMDKIQDNGVYLLENGIYMFIWVGMNVSTEWLQNVFGVRSAAEIDIDHTKILNLDNPTSQGIRKLIWKIREERHRHMKLAVIRQRDKLEIVFKQFLVEDKGLDGSPSYVDFLCQMHKEIRNLLT